MIRGAIASVKPKRAPIEPERNQDFLAAAAAVSTEHDHVELSDPPKPAFDLGALRAKTASKAKSLAARIGAHRPREVLVKLPNVALFDEAAEREFFADFGFSSERQIKLTREMTQRVGGRYFLARLSKNMTVPEAIAALRADGRALSADPNNIVTRDQVVLPDSGNSIPNQDYDPPAGAPDDLLKAQWNLHNEGQTGGVKGVDVDAPEAWNLSTGRGVTVAVLDTGIDLENPDLIPNLWTNTGEIAGDGIDNDNNGYIDDVHGINLVNRSQPPDDDNDHGTQIASVIGAAENEGLGMVGLAPDAKLLPIKFMERGGRGDIASAIEGISYAEAQGARIVVNGWMTRVQNQSLFEVVAASSALHVCSAGNDGYDNDIRPVHPASFPLDNVLSVAATDHHDDFTKFTNRGQKTVDLAAPGRKVPAYDKKGNISLQGGAAIAAAHVGAAAALVVSRYPEIDNRSLATRLTYNGDPLPENSDRVASGKRLNAATALREDIVAPGAPREFSATAADGQNLILNFGSVADNGVGGASPVAFYEARISSRPISAEGSDDTIAFDEATSVAMNLDHDVTPGQQVVQHYSLGPSGEQRHFHLAVRATDKAGNRSDLATSEVLVPKSRVVYEDGFEAPADGSPETWTMEGSWARVPVAGRGMVMTDSPEGDYDNDSDYSLTSPTIDLKGLRSAKLHFDARYTIEPKHDGCFVEVETNGWFGKKWKKVARLDGHSGWKNHQVDLSDYAGKDLKFRFRMETDRDRVAYGIQLDHLSISSDDEL